MRLEQARVISNAQSIHNLPLRHTSRLDTWEAFLTLCSKLREWVYHKHALDVGPAYEEEGGILC